MKGVPRSGGAFLRPHHFNKRKSFVKWTKPKIKCTNHKVRELNFFQLPQCFCEDHWYPLQIQSSQLELSVVQLTAQITQKGKPCSAQRTARIAAKWRSHQRKSCAPILISAHFLSFIYHSLLVREKKQMVRTRVNDNATHTRNMRLNVDLKLMAGDGK